MSRRIQVTVSDECYERLVSESKRARLSVAELVRRAIERSYGPATVNGDLSETLNAGFGTWLDRDFDGEQYVDALRQGAFDPAQRREFIALADRIAETTRGRPQTDAADLIRAFRGAGWQ